MSGWVKAHDAAWGRSIHSNPYQPISNFDIHHATKGFEPQKKKTTFGALLPVFSPKVL
jgi:hypothetical protein